MALYLYHLDEEIYLGTKNSMTDSRSAMIDVKRGESYADFEDFVSDSDVIF